ncbi:hypothetical protein [Pararhizobium sp. IMCC21322]|uniref:hypothetical protein n=1 Tax=Pararhizobium sp. IMCC21322 TaxID=3067903 RepID=UPI002740E3D3|nr:hypothetical protein [Pararhizobium sp. IMCC21322]
MVQLGDHFKDKNGNRINQAGQQRWFIKARQDKQRRDDAAEKLDDNILATAAETVMATQIQIEAFEAKLDSYDEATVIALMENQAAMDLITARINDLLARAHVMEDGRRVFKTEDGAQVFDEFGQEVSPEELDSDLIDATHPTWESFSALDEQRTQLSQEQQELFEFQEKVDAARVEASEEGLTEKRLEELDAELLDAMPPEVGMHIVGYQPPSPAPDMTAAFAAKAMPAIIPSTTGVQAVYKPEM